MLMYTNDCIVISDRADPVLKNEIGKYFKLKQELIGPHGQYLGGKLWKLVLDNGSEAWAFGSKQYVEAAVNNVTDYLTEQSQKLAAKPETPLSNGHNPEVDISDELEPQDTSY